MENWRQTFWFCRKGRSNFSRLAHGMIKQSWSTSNLKSNAVPAFNQPLWPMLHKKIPTATHCLFFSFPEPDLLSCVDKSNNLITTWSSVQVLLHCPCSLPMFAMLCWCWCLLNCCCIALIFINFFSPFFGTNWYFYFSIMTKIQPCMWHAFFTFTNLTKSITLHGTLVTPEGWLEPILSLCLILNNSLNPLSKEFFPSPSLYQIIKFGPPQLLSNALFFLGLCIHDSIALDICKFLLFMEYSCWHSYTPTFVGHLHLYLHHDFSAFSPC